MAPGRATIDFFAGQAEARRRTALLVAGFAAAVGLVVALVYLALLLPVGMKLGVASWWNARLLAWVAAGVGAVTAVGATYHAAVLGADGGDAVARRLGAVPLGRLAADPGQRRFLDVLEEMSIAAGLPVPRAYLLPLEAGVNAFAAGASPSRAVVVVTQGALDALTRDELQGVVAHELSHVLNHDMRLNGRLLAVVGGLTALSEAGGLLLRVSGRGRRTPAPLALIAFAGFSVAVAGAIGRLCGELLRFAVAREREYLADAAAAQFTRNPAGLASALRKASERGSLLVTPAAAQVSHFLFANGVDGVLETWFATHPPIEERVRRLEAGAGAARPIARAPGGERAQGRVGSAPGTESAALMAAAGAPGPAHVAAAGALLAALPAPLVAAAREPYAARALACGLLLAKAGPLRDRQLARLAERDAGAAGELRSMVPLLERQGGDARVALLDLLLPALDALSPAQAEALRDDLAAVAAEARQGAVLSWACHRTMTRRLERRLAGNALGKVKFRAVEDVEVECHLVLSLLAWVGAREPGPAQDALDAATRDLRGRASWRILPRDRLAGEGPARALARLDEASPRVKAKLLAACAVAVAVDGRITSEEAALVRAVAASLGCPLPPLVMGSPAGVAAAVA